MVVLIFKDNENTYSKGKVFVQMYRVVPITKRGNYGIHSFRRDVVCW